ncbi:MAG: anti-sigma factor [Gemmatimonadetes bacterium]|nr:anti-sigma factor [Gemmatimonadota bacterium]
MSEDHGWSDYPASYALGVLDDEERTAFEAHLAGCEACRADVRAFRETADALAWAAPARQTPAGLRDRILRDARSVRPIRSAPGAESRTADPGARPDPTPSTSRTPAGGRPWLVAATIALAIGAALFVRERSLRIGLEETIARLASEADTMQTRLAELDAELASRDSLLTAVLAPDIRTVRLSAQGQPPSARIFWSRERGRIVIAAFDLDPAPAGRTYQLWGIAGGAAPVSLGVFNTAADGRAVVSFDVAAALSIDVAAITEEPAGGSPQPTTTPFLVGGIGP